MPAARLMRDLAVLILWVAAGSAVGGLARFFVSGLVARAIGETFPWGTMVVNITGAFGIGVLAALARRQGLLIFPEAWSIAATGLLGSYTTVSSFSLQTLALARAGEWLRAAGNIVLSLALCLGAAALGMAAPLQAAGESGLRLGQGESVPDVGTCRAGSCCSSPFPRGPSTRVSPG